MLNIPENKSPWFSQFSLEIVHIPGAVKGVFTVRGMLAKDLLGFSKNRWADHQNWWIWTGKAARLCFHFNNAYQYIWDADPQLTLPLSDGLEEPTG